MPVVATSHASDIVYAYDAARAKLQPRGYQQELITALGDRVRTGPVGARLLAEVATGGGKSLIANDVLWKQVGEGKRILCVTMAANLGAQAAADLVARHKGALRRVSFVASAAGRRAMRGLREGAGGQVVYTTIHTWNARKNTDFAGRVFDVVFIDEVHWGEEAPLYDELFDRYESAAVFVGLTATPRRWSQYERVGRAYNLRTLVDLGYLAEPRLESIETGVSWSPRRANRRGDVTAASLRELAGSAARNALIVSTYTDSACRYGKTIVFACGIAHAENLAQQLSARGVRAAAVHSKMKDVHRLQVARAFRRGDIQVLVNVVSAVHGLDVPDIKTVMLARPTASDILMAQMIGRGTRLAAGKDCFHLVDFVDNAALHGGVMLVRPDGFLGSRLAPGARGELISHHDYHPAGLAPFPPIEGYGELAGLLVQRDQTFGIEFELTSLGVRHDRVRGWKTLAEKLLEALRAASLPTATTLDTGDNALWNVKADASCGWEITSRILRGFAGFIEISDACDVIQKVAAECGLGVSVKTGTHVHLGWSTRPAPLLKLFEITAYFEPALMSLVAPSRATTTYAKPVRRLFKTMRLLASEEEWAAYLTPESMRYRSVNAQALFGGYGTVEIRLHSGTIEAPKILTWISLWMAIMAAAEEGRPLPGDAAQRLYRTPLCPGPRGDVAQLATFAGASAKLVEKLVARRNHVVSRWWTQAPVARNRRLAERLLALWAPILVAVPVTAAAAE